MFRHLWQKARKLRYICLCKGITDSQIRQAVAEGAENVRAVRERLGVSTQCGRCACDVREIVNTAVDDNPLGEPLFYSIA